MKQLVFTTGWGWGEWVSERGEGDKEAQNLNYNINQSWRQSNNNKKVGTVEEVIDSS